MNNKEDKKLQTKNPQSQVTNNQLPVTNYQLLISALCAAKEAGDAILEVYHSDFAVEHKDDRSPLTRADTRSHEIITQHLSHITDFSVPILSEEGKEIPYDERKQWETFWLVDPLDGTKEFIKRNGEFTVNIALIHNERPVLGVIFVPVRDVFYFAAQSLGAYKVVNSQMVTDALSFDELIKDSITLPVTDQTSPINNNQSHITIIGSRSHGSPELQKFVERMKQQYETVNFISAGSSLKFCLVAEGVADVYPRYGPTMEWDTGAGQCIAEEAGCTVIRFDTGETLLYNKEELLNPWFEVTQ